MDLDEVMVDVIGISGGDGGTSVGCEEMEASEVLYSWSVPVGCCMHSI